MTVPVEPACRADADNRAWRELYPGLIPREADSWGLTLDEPAQVNARIYTRLPGVPETGSSWAFGCLGFWVFGCLGFWVFDDM